MSFQNICTRFQSGCQRRMARWLGRRAFSILPGQPIISFTFDDFPRSALFNGGRILEDRGLAGTYYIALGLMNQVIPTGEIFHLPDLEYLIRKGHELGCHTFDHCPAWETSPQKFEASMLRNMDALNRVAPGQVYRTLSYPISYPRPATKRRVGRRFACARGGGQIFNQGRVDLNYLSAFFLEQSRDNPEVIRDVIERNREAGGWLIFATHDVCENPTRYGCTPELFEEVVNCAVKSGALILPVFQAWERIRTRTAKAS